MSATDEQRDLIAAYAVGAVTDDERVRAERLVAEHAALRAELDQHHELLASLVSPTDIDPGSFDRLLQALPSRPTDLATRRAPAGRWVLAVAATVGLLLVGIGLVRQDRPEGPADLAQLAAIALADPTREVFVLDDPTSGDPVARASFAGDPATGETTTGFVVIDDLPATTPDSTYQLWALGTGEDDPPISLGLIDPGPDDPVAAFVLEPGATGVAISREPAGGSVAPTAVVAVGLLR
jgi:anti-sigma-K factor RskA